jgi:glycosyltransferase involved in cell wall biosynthesis
MIRACALMAVYNEADVVREAVTKLIDHGVDVHLIDNASTDGTADRVADLVGQGVTDIEEARFFENGREVYNWTALLKMKEDLSRRLGYDWYLHVDADEIRYPPWPGVSLREGLDRVDAAGYNLINFKLFNFRLTEDTVYDGDWERSMPLYSGAERFNQRQVKVWKAHPEVDLANNMGGHHIRVPGAKVFPTRFIHKHYPVRSLEHGRRKILAERKARFSTAERQRGWHLQYDHLNEVDPKDVFWDPARLTAFDLERESHALFVESTAVLSEALVDDLPLLDEGQFVRRWVERLTSAGTPADHAARLLGVADHIAQALARQDLPPIAASASDSAQLGRIIASLARVRFLGGDPLLYGRLGQLAFKVS